MYKMTTSAKDKIEPIQKSNKWVIVIHFFNLLPKSMNSTWESNNLKCFILLLIYELKIEHSLHMYENLLSKALNCNGQFLPMVTQIKDLSFFFSPMHHKFGLVKHL
jgi:hypothetical protein